MNRRATASALLACQLILVLLVAGCLGIQHVPLHVSNEMGSRVAFNITLYDANDVLVFATDVDLLPADSSTRDLDLAGGQYRVAVTTSTGASNSSTVELPDGPVTQRLTGWGGWFIDVWISPSKDAPEGRVWIDLHHGD